MTLKTKIIISLVVILVAFAFGRFTCPVKTVTQIKTVEVEKKQENVDDKKNEKVVIVKKPDGTTTTTITKDEDKKTQEKDQTNIDSSTTKTVERSGQRVSISALAGETVTSPGNPVYGLAINKEFIGPITIGAFGFNNGLVGLSVGLNF